MTVGSVPGRQNQTSYLGFAVWFRIIPYVVLLFFSWWAVGFYHLYKTRSNKEDGGVRQEQFNISLAGLISLLITGALIGLYIYGFRFIDGWLILLGALITGAYYISLGWKLIFLRD